MKKILTYDDFLEHSMLKIEENIINHPELYSYEETFEVHKLFILFKNKFKEYEKQIKKLGKQTNYNRTEKIKDLITRYENIIRDV